MFHDLRLVVQIAVSGQGGDIITMKNYQVYLNNNFCFYYLNGTLPTVTDLQPPVEINATSLDEVITTKVDVTVNPALTEIADNNIKSNLTPIRLNVDVTIPNTAIGFTLDTIIKLINHKC